MAALPYIQLYVADYLADTMHLTTEEHGAYLLIIMNYWQTGKPVKKSKLPSITKLSNERWNSVELTLNEFFTEPEQGYWYHARIEGDLNRVKSKSIQASKAGKLSAAKRAASKVIDNKEVSNGRLNSVQRKSNHTDTEAYTDTYKPKDMSKSNDLNLFDEFWKDWPRKDDKKKAMIAFNRLSKTKKQQAIEDSKSRYIGISKEYIPLPTTYIHGERWDDELIARKENRPEWAKIPRDDEQLWTWAKQHGYSGPGTLTYPQYRSSLSSQVEKRLNGG